MFRRKGKAKQEPICDAIEFGVSEDGQLISMTFKSAGAAINRSLITLHVFADMPPAMKKVLDVCEANMKLQQAHSPKPITQ